MDIEAHHNIPFVAMTKEMLFDNLPVGLIPSNPFTAVLTASFAEYKSAERANKKDELLARRGQSVTHLDPDEFIKKYGDPP